MAHVFVGLGSNLGDKKENLSSARQHISMLPGTIILKTSSIIETEPWGNHNQPVYYNSVLLLDTNYNPAILLSELLNIEYLMGRRRDIKWGPRIIDLDILSYEDVLLKTDNLILPHPYLEERSFVLYPILEICPEWIHPETKKTIIELVKSFYPPKIICKPEDW